jgi:hypothetical protein
MINGNTKNKKKRVFNTNIPEARPESRSKRMEEITE